MSGLAMLCLLLGLLHLGVGRSQATKKEKQEDRASRQREGPFKYYSNREGWSDANQICLDNGSILAVASTLDESKIMRKTADKHPDGAKLVFVGFQDILRRGEFSDAAGHRLLPHSYTLTFLDSSSGPNKHCGVMHRDGHFSLAPCDDPLPFICQRQKPPPPHVSFSTRLKNSHIGKFLHRIFG